MRLPLIFMLMVTSVFLCACSGADDTIQSSGDDAGTLDASPFIDAAVTPAEDADGARDGERPDGGTDTASDAGRPAHYANKVISHTIGATGGAGEERLPDVVLGAPHGGGCCAGSTDTLSLGEGGEIVLGFDVAIVDEPGPDFLVFENPFQISGDPERVLFELGEVSVSEDGVTWKTFPCTATTYPFGTCAGWHPVLATEARPVDLDDPTRAGGDPFDLADVGLGRVRFVRVRDALTKFPPGPKTGGFDLDAVAVLHGVAE